MVSQVSRRWFSGCHAPDGNPIYRATANLLNTF
jgi:hypothetical protein